MMTGESVKTIIKVVLIFVTCLINNSRTCPINCLCYLDKQPRSVLCSDQGLDEFPVRISGLVRIILQICRHRIIIFFFFFHLYCRLNI